MALNGKSGDFYGRPLPFAGGKNLSIHQKKP